MKILYVLDTYPIYSETFIRDEIEELISQGNTVYITTFNYGDKSYPLKDILKPDAVLNQTPYSKYEALKGFMMNINRFAFSFKQSNIPKKEIIYHSLKIYNLAKKYKVDYIHSHFGLNAAAFAIQASKLLNKPSSFTVHGYDINKLNIDIEEKVAYADKIISVSEYLKSEMIRKNNLTEELSEKIKVIPFGVKVEQSQNFNTRNNRYLFVGRFNKVKGLEHIIKLWKENKDLPWIDLIGFGDEDYEARLRKEISENKLKINILGKKDSKYIYNAMASYKAIILPFQKNKKTGEMDTGAIVAKEAMLNKIPVITTDLIPHIVSKEQGFIAKSGCKDSLMLKIKDFQNENQKDINRKLDSAYLSILNKYSIKKQIKEFTLWLQTQNKKAQI